MLEISLALKLRPIKFAFIVDPKDKESISTIFKINSFLWGGLFNPIIPYYNKFPRKLNLKETYYKGTKEFTNCYLDLFEPDFIIEGKEGIAQNIDFNSKRILQLINIIPYIKHKYYLYGCNVYDLYNMLYEKEFKFELRSKKDIVYIHTQNQVYDLFVSCVFGSFPSEGELFNFRNLYNEIFNPTILTLDSNILQKLYTNQYISPLSITCNKLEISR